MSGGTGNPEPPAGEQERPPVLQRRYRTTRGFPGLLLASRRYSGSSNALRGAVSGQPFLHNSRESGCSEPGQDLARRASCIFTGGRCHWYCTRNSGNGRYQYLMKSLLGFATIPWRAERHAEDCRPSPLHPLPCPSNSDSFVDTTRTGSLATTR